MNKSTLFSKVLPSLLLVALTACGPAAEVAEIVCEAEGTQVLTPLVQVQADGVHLRVDNRASGERYVYKQENPTSAFNQHQAPAGLSETVSEEGPGSWKVICAPPNDYPQAGSSWVPVVHHILRSMRPRREQERPKEVVDLSASHLRRRLSRQRAVGLNSNYLAKTSIRIR